MTELDLSFEEEQEPDIELDPAPTCGSHLVVDIGRGFTSATLFDLVEGQFRFIARGSSLTTSGAPWNDLGHGFRDALNQITRTTGRILLNNHGYLISPSRLDGSGIDCLGIVVSAADPLRTILIGLSEDVSLASARKALRTIYSLEIDSFSLTDSRSENSKLESLLTNNPDLVVIVGGSDGGTDSRLMELIDTLVIGLNLLDDFQRPQVIYAGNSAHHSEVLDQIGELTDIFIAANVRPSVEVENLDDLIGQLSAAYDRQKVNDLPGILAIKDLASVPVSPTAHAYGGILEFFSELNEGLIVGLDIGSNSISLAAANPGYVDLFVRSDLGLGQPLTNILNNPELSELFSWTDGQTRATEVRDFIYNKSLMSQTVPQNVKELKLEQAIAGMLVKDSVSKLPADFRLSQNGRRLPLELLVLRGRVLSDAPHPGYPLLAVIDGLQPTGVFRLVIDEQGILPAMGLLATHRPQLVVQVLDSGVLKEAGWVVVANGKAEIGRPVVRVSLEIEGSKTIKREVKFGDLELIPLSEQQTAELTVRPLSSFDVGAGAGRAVTKTIKGGWLGLLVDARGRPIEISGDEVTKRSHRQQWLRTVGS